MSIETAISERPIPPTKREAGIELARDDILKHRSSLAWQAFAACSGAPTELFFPEVGANRKDIQEALKYCAKCDVKDLCLLYAVSSGERFGIWGGLTPKPRQALVRRITNAGRQR